MKKNFLLLLTLTIVLSLNACANEIIEPAAQSAERQTANQQAAQEQDTIITELIVLGMTCNGCVNNVAKAVSALDGVVDVSVDLSAEKVTVEHEPELDVDMIKKIIETEGYNIP